ncbi:efflux RND transporter periplasmic adaptor subunit [Elongatibacter sediminis]|uniref:Efflux RND transporter periplasmic adaptor subunit n=1 Tax=Elongatibacter sediminis TaxID=3119006 RepID=A0AAW9R9Y4_9GAMM
MNATSSTKNMSWIGMGLAGLLLGGWLGWVVAHRMGPAPPGEAADADASTEPVKTAAPGEPEVLYWVAPMDPNYRRDEPGKSPMGMDLVPVYANSEPDSSGAVSINPAVEQNLGIRTRAAEFRPLWRRIEATGYVGFDQNRLEHIHLRTSGWVQNLQVNAEGERVRAGDLLFEFYAPDLLNAQKEFLQARRRGDARLAAAGRQKLLALGMERGEIDELDTRGAARQTIAVLAPADGVITSLNVRAGAYVEPATEVMSVADLSTVWMQAEVFESQADWVATGQSAEARLDYMPGEVFAGEVDYVYPVLDPQTRTLRVRLRFDNPGERLKPNMYARVTIYGKTHLDALAIPRDAVIRAPERDRVVVALGDGRFRSHEVMTGIESGEWVEVIAGLDAGDEVVTSAQFLLDSEASLTGSLRRLESGAERDDAPPRVVFGSGVVDAVDRTARRMRISHGPIERLGWPAMTMEFDALPAVDLGRIQTGQNVHFSIRPDASGVYVVEMVHLVEPGAPAGPGDPARSGETIESVAEPAPGEPGQMEHHDHD